VRTRRAAFSRQYDGTAANPRLFAHTISDEIHKSQRALNGVARSKLTFDSDRDGERMSGLMQNRNIKEITSPTTMARISVGSRSARR